ncbi:MAG TPA: hypothetical protein VMT19_06000 [Thermoanaerobaculaceae bacterium]|nr:hypothetical protein [Thermoanaerobaculaceae bacterium]
MGCPSLRLAIVLVTVAWTASAAPPPKAPVAQPTATPTAGPVIPVPPGARFEPPCGIESEGLRGFRPVSPAAEPGPQLLAVKSMKRGTQLDLLSQSGALGQTVPIQARLKLKPEGTAVPNHTVHFWVDDQYLGNARSDGTGTALVQYYVKAFGTKNVVARYFGSDVCADSKDRNELTMVRAPTKFSILLNGGETARVPVGETLYVLGRLMRVTDGLDVEGAAVVITLDGQPQGTVTPPVGGFRWSWTAQPGTAGNHTLVATFDGDSMYLGTAASNGFTVVSAPLPAKLTLGDVTVAVGETKTAVARLTVENPVLPGVSTGKGVPGVSIRLRLGEWVYSKWQEGPFGSATTDGDGVATFNFKMTDQPGHYYLSAIADGVEGLLEVHPKEVTANLLVQKAPVVVGVAGPTSARVGDTVTFTVGVLRATDGTPLPSMDVTLETPPYWLKTTAANGQAVFPIVVLADGPIGVRTVTAKSSATSWYLEGTGSTTINVLPKTN